MEAESDGDVRGVRAALGPALRRATARGAVVGLLVGLAASVLVVVVSLVEGVAPKGLLIPALFIVALTIGAALVPAYFIEEVAARTARTTRDRVLAAALAAATVVVALLPGYLELVYVNYGLGDPARGAKHVMDSLGHLKSPRFLLGCAMLAVPVFPVIALRLGGHGLIVQTGAGAIPLTVLTAAVGMLARADDDRLGACAVAVFIALLAPIAFRITDALSRRLLARLAPDPS